MSEARWIKEADLAAHHGHELTVVVDGELDEPDTVLLCETCHKRIVGLSWWRVITARE